MDRVVVAVPAEADGPGIAVDRHATEGDGGGRRHVDELVHRGDREVRGQGATGRFADQQRVADVQGNVIVGIGRGVDRRGQPGGHVGQGVAGRDRVGDGHSAVDDDGPDFACQRDAAQGAGMGGGGRRRPGGSDRVSAGSCDCCAGVEGNAVLVDDHQGGTGHRGMETGTGSVDLRGKMGGDLGQSVDRACGYRTFDRRIRAGSYGNGRGNRDDFERIGGIDDQDRGAISLGA